MPKIVLVHNENQSPERHVNIYVNGEELRVRNELEMLNMNHNA